MIEKGTGGTGFNPGSFIKSMILLSLFIFIFSCQNQRTMKDKGGIIFYKTNMLDKLTDFYIDTVNFYLICQYPKPFEHCDLAEWIFLFYYRIIQLFSYSC